MQILNILCANAPMHEKCLKHFWTKHFRQGLTNLYYHLYSFMVFLLHRKRDTRWLLQIHTCRKKKELRFPLLFWGRSHIVEVVLQLTSELRMILNFPSSHVLGKEACNLILKDKLHRRVTVARTHASSTCVSEETLAKTACTFSPLLIKCIGHVSG